MPTHVVAHTRLGQYRDAYVAVTCSACRHEREMPAEVLARFIGVGAIWHMSAYGTQ